MDPQQVWQDIVDFVNSIDIEDLDPLSNINTDDLIQMVEQVLALNQWLLKGGFPPIGTHPGKEVEQEVIHAEIKNEYPWDRLRR